MVQNSPALKKKYQEFMHNIQKIAVDVTFTQMTTNTGINMHVERAISDMYKDYIQLDDKKFIGR